MLLLIFVASCFYIYYAYKFRFFSSRGIPGPRPVTFLGNMLDTYQKPWMSVAARHVQTFGPVYGVFDGSTPKLVVADPQLVKQIMVQDFTHFTDRNPARLSHPIEQKMMVGMQGAKWAAWRKIMTPAFSPQKLKLMEPMMQISVDNLIDEIEKRAGGGEADVDVRAISDYFALEALARTGLGIEMNLNQASEPIIDSLMKYIASSPLNLVLSFMLPEWLKKLIKYKNSNEQGLEEVVAYITAVIHERRKDSELKGHADLTSILMSASKDSNPLPEDEITATMVDIMLAGFTGIGLLLSSAIFSIAQHPRIQQRLHEEVMSLTAGDKKNVDVDSVKDMKFMEAVLNETLRFYPPSSYTDRKVSKAYDMNGITLPVGLNISILTYLLQHDEKYHPAAKSFDPDRFMPDRISLMDPFTFMPFGQGPRNCPAGRFTFVLVKIALSRLMLPFEFVKSDHSPEFIDVSGTMDELLVTSEFTVRFRKRNFGAIN